MAERNIEDETPSQYLLGQIMAERMTTEIHIKAFMEIARILSEEFPKFTTVRDQVKNGLLSEAEKMRTAVNEDGNHSDAFYEGFNSGVDQVKKFIEDVP